MIPSDPYRVGAWLKIRDSSGGIYEGRVVRNEGHQVILSDGNGTKLWVKRKAIIGVTEVTHG